MDLEKTAAVLDSVANLLETLEQDKEAEETSTKIAALQKLNEHHTKLTGSPLVEDDGQLKKLAGALDDEALKILEKVASISAENDGNADFGQASGTSSGSEEPTSMGEKVATAYEEFGRWAADASNY